MRAEPGKQNKAIDPVLLGAALRFLRQQGPLKQYQLARLAGITKGMLSNYETGKHLPNLETLLLILNSLDVDLGKLQDALNFISGKGPREMATFEEKVSPEQDEREIGTAVVTLIRTFLNQLRDANRKPRLPFRT